MIEDEIRRAFARREHTVPDGDRLRPVIDATAGRRRIRRRVLTSAAAVLAVLAVSVPAIAARSWLTRPAPSAPGSAAPITGRPMNFLIAGTDDASTWDPPTGYRDSADTIIVAHLPANRAALYLITIPRDLWVDDVPGQPQITLSQTYQLGGFKKLASTVSAYTGLTFDGAAKISLAGLAGLTDAVGGVSLCVDYAFTSWHTGTRYPVGCASFDGARATDYLRERFNFERVHGDDPGSDAYGLIRDRHQVEYLRALLAKVDPVNLALHPDRLAALATAAGTGLVVDLNGHTVTELAAELRPALHSVVGLAMPPGTRTVHGDDRTGWTGSPAGHDLFAAVVTDRVAEWSAANPTAVMRLE